jgi:hypothetical protein
VFATTNCQAAGDVSCDLQSALLLCCSARSVDTEQSVGHTSFLGT